MSIRTIAVNRIGSPRGGRARTVSSCPVASVRRRSARPATSNSSCPVRPSASAEILRLALAPKLGIELDELDSVTCCGAGDIHEAEPDYYLHLNARILAYAESRGHDLLMTICNVCTLNLRQANFQLQGDDALRARVSENLEKVGAPPYGGTVDVKHLLWLIAEGDGYEKLKQVAHKGLKGLKVAPFYGCQILRPSKLLGFEDPDRPESLERIIAACGGEPIDYPAKIKCCGFPIIQAREETALGELIQPGARVFVLCNFVQHRRRAEPMTAFHAKCTHASVIRPVVDYALKAVGPEGIVSFGNAPVQGADWHSLLRDTGSAAILDFFSGGPM